MASQSWPAPADSDFIAVLQIIAPDLSEAAVLCLPRRFLVPLAGTALRDAAQLALIRLRQLVTPRTLACVEALARAIHQTNFGHSDYSARTTVIDDLMLASARDAWSVCFITHSAVKLRSSTGCTRLASSKQIEALMADGNVVAVAKIGY